MRTVIRQEALHDVSELMKDKEWANTINNSQHMLNSGEYPEEYVDIIVQKSRHEGGRLYTLVDAYCFAIAHTMIMTGEIAMAAFMVGDEPFADKCHDLQNEALSKLPEHVCAEFWGGTQGGDGRVVTTKPVHAVVRNGKLAGWGIIPPQDNGMIDLEVGTQCAEKTCFELIKRWGIARWPYHSKYLYLLVKRYKNGTEDDFGECLMSAADSTETAIDAWKTFSF